MRPQRGLVLIAAVALVAVACTTSPTGPGATTATSGSTSSTLTATASSTSTQTTTTSPATTPSPSTTTQPLPASTATTAVTTTTSSTTSTTTPPDTTPPRLEVTYPTHGAIMTEEVITFRGVTEPGAQVFSGRYAADVNPNGTWSLVLVLAPGDNGAVLVARDASGNETTVRLTVTLNRCQDLPSTSIPDTADNLSSVTGDLDGNGADDTVTVYIDTADHTAWVHMALDYEYATAAALSERDGGWFHPGAISTVTFDESNALALVKVSEGATNWIFGVFALVGCDVVYTTSDPDGGLFGFNVGASMRYAFGTTCTPTGIVFRESWLIDESGDDWDSGLWEITDAEYAYSSDRGHFDLVSLTTTQLTWFEIQAQDVSLCHFDCPGEGGGC